MDIDRARLSVKFFAERLRSQTSGLLAQEYPGNHPGPRKWLRLVEGLLDTADSYLNTSQEPAKDDAEKQSLIRDASQMCSLGYACLDLFTGADIKDLPYPIVPPLQRWFDEARIINDTFFRCELAANYELKSIDRSNFDRIRDQQQSLSEAIGEIEWPILRITVPSKALGIIPHFAIVAHEIGHAIFPRVQWDLNAFAGEQTSLISRVVKRLNQQTIDSRTYHILQKCFASWFQELASDAFAFLLTGPASFFSLSDFLQLLAGGYGLSETHPAHDLRRRLLYEKLCENDGRSFSSVFKKYTGCQLTEDFNSPLILRTPNKNQIYLDIFNKTRDQNLAAVLSELHESIYMIIDIIYEQTEKHLRSYSADSIYTPERYDQDLDDHFEPMLAAVPPIESGSQLSSMQPTEFSTIINIGWAVLLTKLPQLRVRTGDDPVGSEKMECLHGLLLKAVELSEARRLWSSV